MLEIVCSLIFSVIGVWLFRKAKKETNFTLLFIAVALMFYSYFTKGPLADWGVGLGLCGLAYYFR
jgi:hypothetical protein